MNIVRYKDNPKEYLRQWRLRRRDHVKAYARKYRMEHRLQTRERQNRWWPVKHKRSREQFLDALAPIVAADCVLPLSIAQKRLREIGITYGKHS